MRTSGRYRLLLVALMLALAAQINLRLDRMEKSVAPRHSLFLPEGRYLRLAALGYRELLADMLYVWSIQYYSTERDDRWRHLARFYAAITDLDPHSVAPYSVGALMLSLEAGNRREALVLLDKGIAAIPDTYLLAWEAGFYARDLGESALAERYLATAAARPDAPGIVNRWRASLASRRGDSKAALRLWVETYEQARSDYEREVAERWVHDLSLEIRLSELRKLVGDFATHEGRLPLSWDELVHAGLLDRVPADARGHAIQYDRKDGTVEPTCGFLSRQGP